MNYVFSEWLLIYQVVKSRRDALRDVLEQGAGFAGLLGSAEVEAILLDSILGQLERASVTDNR